MCYLTSFFLLRLSLSQKGDARLDQVVRKKEKHTVNFLDSNSGLTICFIRFEL